MKKGKDGIQEGNSTCEVSVMRGRRARMTVASVTDTREMERGMRDEFERGEEVRFFSSDN